MFHQKKDREKMRYRSFHYLTSLPVQQHSDIDSRPILWMRNRGTDRSNYSPKVSAALKLFLNRAKKSQILLSIFACVALLTAYLFLYPCGHVGHH